MVEKAASKVGKMNLLAKTSNIDIQSLQAHLQRVRKRHQIGHCGTTNGNLLFAFKLFLLVQLPALEFFKVRGY